MTNHVLASSLASLASLTIGSVLLCAPGRASADEATQARPAKELRVCGDPNNLPFSNEKLEGIENKLADVVAKELGATVTYFWWPHQRGVVKRVLNAKHCDVMLGIPKGY